MNKCSLTPFILCAALAACATSAPKIGEGDESFAQVESLVTEVGPRFAGSAGDARAVAWALARMKALGFSNVHAEAVKVPHWVRGNLKLAMTGSHLQVLDGVALGGSVATPPGGLEAEVVRVDSLEELEWVPDEKIRGRIVFFDGRMERTADGTGYRNAVPQRVKGPTRAARKGALAVVIRSIGTDDQPVAHTGTTLYDDGKTKIPAAALTPQSADLLEKALADGPVNLQFAFDSENLPETDSANVVGDVPGKTGEIVLLAAHLDSWDITPGANDDGAGVATVLEAARQILAAGKQPQRTIRVVLYANEEFGLSGAKAYAAAHAAELDRHVLAMEADLGSGALLRLDGKVPPDHWAAVEKMAAAAGVPLGKNGEDGGSDIGPLRARGVPVLSPVANAEQYFDVHHTRVDSADRIDRAGLARNAAAYARFAWTASEEPGGFGRLEGLGRGGHTLGWGELSARPLPPAARHYTYGSAAEQFGELRVPQGKGPFPVAVIVHGGCWRNEFDLEHATRISAALAASGIATWTLEYRRVGDTGGGWPGTFQDVAAGTDLLRTLAKANRLDLTRVIAIGHSAGGQLSLWLASRGGIAPGSELYRKNPLKLSGVIGLAPITDLAAYASVPNCGEAVAPLMGGLPEAQAARYRQVSPAALPAPTIPVRILHGQFDRIVPIAQSQDYVQRVPAAKLIVLDDMGHFEPMSPASNAWPKLVAAAQELVKMHW